jgi:hypothetical protein
MARTATKRRNSTTREKFDTLQNKQRALYAKLHGRDTTTAWAKAKKKEIDSLQKRMDKLSSQAAYENPRFSRKQLEQDAVGFLPGVGAAQVIGRYLPGQREMDRFVQGVNPRARRNSEDIELLNNRAPELSIGHLDFVDFGSIERYIRSGVIYHAFTSTPVFPDGYRVGAPFESLDNIAYENPARYNHIVRRLRNPDVASPTSTSADVSSPTSTSADVSSPTSTKTATDAYTSRNLTVTGGAGAGATNVAVYHQPSGPDDIGRSYRSAHGDLLDLPMQAQFRDKEHPPTVPLQSHFRENPIRSRARGGANGYAVCTAQGLRNPSGYQVRFIRPDQANELFNLYHLARVPLSGTGKDTPYERMLWASKEFHKVHPEISETAAYKDLDGLRSNWFGGDSPRPSRGRRRNPESSADALYESFHGAPPSETLEIHEDEHVHGYLAGLGDLVLVEVRLTGGVKAGGKTTLTAPDPSVATPENIVHVASNEHGTQLYLVGGDQRVDVMKLGFRDSFDVKHDGEVFEASELKDLMIIGEIQKLTYRTQKGFDNFEDIDYFHKLGEDTRARPFLLYDTMNDRMRIAGGEYHIHDVGIVN